MTKEMKISGAAPLIAIPTFIYWTITIVISDMSENRFNILNNNKIALIVLGLILITIGIIMVVHCAKKLLSSFNNNKLMTDGLYKIFKDPMYAAYMIFVIPGVTLLFNSWLAMTTVIINYVLYSVFIRKEHVYLRDKFGNDYDEYRKTVLIKFL